MNSQSHLFDFLRHSLLARIGFAIVLVLILAALFAPWIGHANPSAQNLRFWFPSVSCLVAAPWASLLACWPVTPAARLIAS